MTALITIYSVLLALGLVAAAVDIFNTLTNK